MNKLLAALVAAFLVLTGCTALPPGLILDGKSPTGGAATITGRATHLGGNPGQALTLGLKQYTGLLTGYQKTSVSTRTDSSGTYSFTGLQPGKYQVFYDDGGETVDREVNTVGVYVSAPVDLTSTAQVNFDVGWNLNPLVLPGSVFSTSSSDAFGFSPYRGSGTDSYQYQVLVANAQKGAVWSSTWATKNTFTWNGKSGSEVAVPTTDYGGVGQHYYQVKFRSPSGSFGGDSAYGQTKWVPITLTH